MEWYKISYRTISGAIRSESVQAENEDEAQEKFIESFEDEDLPIPVITSILEVV